MRIFIGTDSRGFNVEEKYYVRKKKGERKTVLHKKYPFERSWISLLTESVNKQHEVVLSATLDDFRRRKRRLVSITSLSEDINFQPYDLAIIQVGLHECLSWNKTVWNLFVNGINKHDLIKSGQKDGLYKLRDLSILKKQLENALSTVTRCLFIGMHSWRFKKQMWKPNMYHYRILEMQNLIGSVDKVDMMNMPMDISWVRHNSSDGIHYNCDTHAFIYGYTKRYIERYGKSVRYFIEQ